MPVFDLAGASVLAANAPRVPWLITTICEDPSLQIAIIYRRPPPSSDWLARAPQCNRSSTAGRRRSTRYRLERPITVTADCFPVTDFVCISEAKSPRKRLSVGHVLLKTQKCYLRGRIKHVYSIRSGRWGDLIKANVVYDIFLCYSSGLDVTWEASFHFLAQKSGTVCNTLPNL